MQVFRNTDEDWRRKDYKHRVYCVACDEWPNGSAQSQPAPRPAPPPAPAPVYPHGFKPRAYN